MKIVFLLISSFAPALAFCQDEWKNVYTERAWAERDHWQKPEELILQLNINAGSRVADLGCHEGYMTFKLSDAVGEWGKVYAVDVDERKIDQLKTTVSRRKIGNIVPIESDVDDPKLADLSLDAILILDTYHEMRHHDKILQEIKKALKPGGRLVICEPIAEERRRNSRTEQERKHELGMSFVLDDLQKAGFKISFKQDPFVDREKIKGDKMWLIVAVK